MINHDAASAQEAELTSILKDYEKLRQKALTVTLSGLESFALANGFSSAIIDGRYYVEYDETYYDCPRILEVYSDKFMDDGIIGKRWESGKGWS